MTDSTMELINYIIDYKYDSYLNMNLNEDINYSSENITIYFKSENITIWVDQDLAVDISLKHFPTVGTKKSYTVYTNEDIVNQKRMKILYYIRWIEGALINIDYKTGGLK